ncbi:MAG: hypothetical protein HRU03_09480, partial [Nanoarchaeales archaeon]|nr:hypothetical protein [Nanoarchaeales archaeon]
IIVAAGAVALGACSSSDSTPKPDKPLVVEKVLKIQEGVTANLNIFGNGLEFIVKSENGGFSTCKNSDTDENVGVSYNSELDENTLNIGVGSYAGDLAAAGGNFKIDCIGTDGKSHSGVADVSVMFDIIPESKLVDIIKYISSANKIEGKNILTNLNYGTQACIDFVDGDTVSGKTNLEHPELCDYTISVGYKSQFAKTGYSSVAEQIASDFSVREGTVVFDDIDKITSSAKLYQNVEWNFYARNTDMYNITAKLDTHKERFGEFDITLFFEDVEGAPGVKKVSLESIFNEDYDPSNGVNQAFYTDNLDDKTKHGDAYNIGIVSFSFENIIGDVTTIDNMTTVAGEVSKDMVEYSNLIK